MHLHALVIYAVFVEKSYDVRVQCSHFSLEHSSRIMEPEFLPLPTWAMRWTVDAQLLRTAMCSIYTRCGRCRPDCPFAHSFQELRTKPVLDKTSLCRDWKKGRCDDRCCKYAHGKHELRNTDLIYKTQLCHWHERGKCNRGDRCRHAHGQAELRSTKSSFNMAPVKVHQ